MKLVVVSEIEGVQLVGHWNSISGFFDDWENLFEFSEVLKYSYASLGHSVDDSSLAYCSFFDELLFDEKV
jgi:phosphoribulokinase